MSPRFAVFLTAMGLIAVIRADSQAQPLSSTNKGFDEARRRLVDDEIVGAGIKDPRVIDAMRATLRHEFVPLNQRAKAYYDMALPIGEKQTISPPFIVAYMTEQLQTRPEDKVLEIGTGSGYQAAVLSPLVREVYTIEIVKALGQQAEKTLKRLKYKNVHTKIGDGYAGWPEHAPFDKIIVTCSPEAVPEALVDQLKDGGRMIVPVGERYQQVLYLFRKRQGRLESEALLPTLFVPMTGQAEAERRIQPDPAHPVIQNGGFEELVDERASGHSKPADEPVAVGRAGEAPLKGWHYSRQTEVVRQDAPEGKQFVRFRNATPGRPAQILQGIAVDGRKVARLRISLQVRGKDIAPGDDAKQLPIVGVSFFADNRAQVGDTWIGPWRGSFDWREVEESLRVPAQTREAIVRIGLGGATGEIDFDNLRMVGEPVSR